MSPVCLHVRTGTQYMYCVPVCNTGTQYMSPVCLHVRTGIAYRYAIPVLHTGTQYRYCVPVRTCKHRYSRAYTEAKLSQQLDAQSMPL